MTWRAERLVVVGVDGGSWDVLEPWCRPEVMPTLTALRQEGSFGVLHSVVPPITPAAWATLLTGQHPGRHRVLDFLRYDPATGSLSLTNSTDLPPANLFRCLEEAGLSLIAVNLPMTYPPPRVPGLLVAGFGTPSPASTFTWPPELKEEVLRLIPDYRFSVPWVARRPEDLTGLGQDVATIARSFADRARLARDLASRRPWNLLFVHLKFLDDFLHKAFGYTQAGASPRGRALVEQCLRGLDQSLGELRALAAEAAAPLLLVSDHGFGSLAGRLYPNALLRRWGYLALTGPLARLGHWLRRHAKRPGTDTASPTTATHALDARIPIDWPRTRAYVMYTGPCPFLYLNRAGREPRGTLSPTQADALLAELAERFRSYRHPAVAGPVFPQVIPGTDFFRGDLTTTPDLVLVPQEGLVPRRRLTSLDREVEPVHTLAGYHRCAGIWLAAGPNVRPGLHLEAHLEDVAPTILAALGVPLPEGTDGRPLLPLFLEPPAETRASAAPGPTGERASAGSPRPEPAEGRRDVYSGEEESEVRRRLADLGYL
jgi:predicted AlkP superfamily phosphohydrolase/phosphomutase